MSQIKLGLAQLSLEQKLQPARDIVSAMTGNANFPTPNPALSAITADLLAAYVQNTSGGDTAKIKSAGMDVKSIGGAVGPLAAPASLSATLEDMGGEIDLHWNRVPGAMSYVVPSTTDPMTAASAWTTLTPSTKSKTVISGLTAGTRYWFRVAGVGSAGQGPWSDPVTKIAQP